MQTSRLRNQTPFARAATILIVLTFTIGAPAVAENPPAQTTIWDGVFDQAQLDAGRAAYAENCVSCHAGTARGGPGGPPLVGHVLNRKHEGASLAGYYEYMATAMPPGRAGSLSRQTYADILAFILSRHGAKPGEGRLTDDADLLDSIYIVRRPKDDT